MLTQTKEAVYYHTKAHHKLTSKDFIFSCFPIYVYLCVCFFANNVILVQYSSQGSYVKQPQACM